MYNLLYCHLIASVLSNVMVMGIKGAIAMSNLSHRAILPRVEQMVEFLSTRYVRDGWSFDQQRAAHFLDAIRTLDLKSEDGSQEVAEIEINSWIFDHGSGDHHDVQ